ncbi:hypothetical protein [Hyalangium rubrum]|uniref:Lipoprotein n=1 Tax=Hyalangium rubrum TaxID=3103134 RepID=A0ABU5H1C1_9BACT|nr:hypothetical protein [Hyalangium sp. s54d21]MDY7227256.1 hypothetical protein [Hyalangium sp. s54d21]
MAAPKPFTVVLILAVFACIALYVLGVGLGATDNSKQGRSSMSKQERAKLRERFFPPRAVKAEELQADCPLANGVLSVVQGRACRVSIAEGGARARTLEVVLVGAGAVALEFTPKGKPALPISVDRLTEPRKLDVMKEGAELVVTCRSPGAGSTPCQVKLQ